MSDKNSSGAEKQKGNPILTALLVGMVVVIALLGAAVGLLLTREQTPDRTVEEEAPLGRSVVVNEENVEQVVEDLSSMEPTPLGYYEVSMNFTWNFPDGASPSTNAYVENVPRNANPVYFDVLLAEDESVALYESPILPLGSHINTGEVVLLRDLDAGTYPCVIVYHLLNGNQKTVSTLRMTMDVVVEN